MHSCRCACLHNITLTLGSRHIEQGLLFPSHSDSGGLEWMHEGRRRILAQRHHTDKGCQRQHHADNAEGSSPTVTVQRVCCV